MWSTSPPMIYTSSYLRSSIILSVSPVRYTKSSLLIKSIYGFSFNSMPQFAALLLFNNYLKSSVSDVTIRFKGFGDLKLFEWQSSIYLYKDVFSWIVI